MRDGMGSQRGLVTLLTIAVLGIAMSVTAAAPVSGATATSAQSTTAMLAQLSAEMRAGQYPGLAGVMLSQQGQLLLSAYAPGVQANQKFDIRSATKSITALLVGIALAQQAKPAAAQLAVTPDSPISRFFPTRLAPGPDSASEQQISLQDLLSMQSGLACNDWQPTSVGHEDLMYQQSDWLHFWWQLPMAHQRGTQFSYCTGNVIALGTVLTQLTGLPVSAFAHQVLLQPLQITDAV